MRALKRGLKIAHRKSWLPVLPDEWPVVDNGAKDRSRTDDLLITNQLLYQLSYLGPRCCSTEGR